MWGILRIIIILFLPLILNSAELSKISGHLSNSYEYTSLLTKKEMQKGHLQFNRGAHFFEINRNLGLDEQVPVENSILFAPNLYFNPNQISDFKLESIQLLDKAYKKSSYQIYRILLEKLINTNFYFPKKNHDFKACSKNAIAFALIGDSENIYFCQYGIKQLQAIEVVQTIIHELAHLVGIKDECEASNIEIGAMMDSGVGVQYYNDYLIPCGLLKIKEK